MPLMETRSEICQPLPDTTSFPDSTCNIIALEPEIWPSQVWSSDELEPSSATQVTRHQPSLGQYLQYNISALKPSIFQPSHEVQEVYQEQFLNYNWLLDHYFYRLATEYNKLDSARRAGCPFPHSGRGQAQQTPPSCKAFRLQETLKKYSPSFAYKRFNVNTVSVGL